MLFSSLIFLFAFLPITLVGYYLARGWTARNILLLAASLFFYAWGEPSYLWLMLLMVVMNYFLSIGIDSSQQRRRKVFLGIAVTVNLGVLLYFKYADFVVGNLNWCRQHIFDSHHVIPSPRVALPLGISFFTFHCLSYVIDIYRAKAAAQRDFVKLGLYISLFPQLIAGPIIRYHEICDQLALRSVDLDKFAEGVRRLVVGLGKKMLVANTVAKAADSIFGLPPDQLSLPLAWLAALSYTIQIYFDFSGYSDMAIGLGLMFGFKFPENFNFPYTAASIQEFWHRWHMTLSNWFRDYLYIPLGGNRSGSLRTCANLVTVFFLCGLWHGASWTFVIWGLYHGLFLGVERLGFARVLEQLWHPLRHCYALLVVVIGWVLFRADSLNQAQGILSAMFGLTAAGVNALPVDYYLTGKVACALLVGIIASTTIFRRIIWKPTQSRLWTPALRAVTVTVILLLSTAELASTSYNPFIYFRF
jgi:alginate O-acetyltransferase complex protein AlgI